MSGFEIVGVVLGSISLLVSAIEKYKTTSQRIKFFRYKEPFVAQLIHSLEYQRYFIETELYIPLRATHLDDDQVNTLLNSPSPSIFTDLEIVDAVREYLGDGYIHYRTAVVQCYKVLAEIASSIGGLASQSPGDLPALLQAHLPKNGKYEFTKKIKFSLQKDDLERRIKDLNNATEMLRRVRETSAAKTEVTLQSTSQTIAKFTSALGNVRNYAHRLYSAISSGYMANCHTEHETRLFLHTRSALMKKRRIGLNKTPVAFTVIFTPGGNTLKSTASYQTDVKVLEEDMDIDYANIKVGPQQTMVTISLPVEQSSPPPESLDDLCYSIKQATDSGKLLDLYLSGGGCLCYRHKSFNASIPAEDDAESEDIVSLEENLNSMTQPSQGPAFRWTLNQRMALSFNIASSVMQLHSTPWLSSSSLTSKDVYFVRSAQSHVNGGMGQVAEVPRPFIRQIFSANHEMPERCACPAKRCMLELGIILIELWQGKTLEKFANEAGLDLGNSFGTRYDLAVNWLELSTYHILPFYLDVATRCIECTFAMSSASPNWNDITFRKSVCEYVLRPLWENCPPEFR